MAINTRRYTPNGPVHEKICVSKFKGMGLLLILLRICVVCTTLIVVVQLQNWHIWSLADDPDNSKVCNTVECTKLGKMYEGNMNPTRDPCDDFFKYTCENWKFRTADLHQINPEMMWTTSTYLEMKALHNMRKLLENKNPSGSKEFERAKEVYRTCTDAPYLARDKPAILRKHMKSIAAFPLLLATNATVESQPTFAEIDLRYMKITGESAFFDYTIQASEILPNEIITELNPLNSAYGSLIRVEGWKKLTELQSYKIFLNDILRVIAEGDDVISTKTIEKDINEVIEFRENLNAIIAQQESHKTRESMTIQQFQKWYNNQCPKTCSAVINWLNVIRAIYRSSDDPRKATIRLLATIKVHSPYFTKIADLLEHTNKRVIVNHIHLYFLERHIELNRNTIRLLRNSVHDCGLRATGIKRGEVHRWKDCIETINMDQVLGKAYVDAYFPRKSKLAVQTLFDASRDLFQQLILDSKWLEADTKNQSVTKINKIKSVLGYPDSYEKSLRRSLSEEMNPLHSSAKYEYESNRISIAAGYFQSPIYTPNVPYVIDYGSTVSLLGHELHHALDVEGIKFGPAGKSSNWPVHMYADYVIRRKCFRDQFTKLKNKTLKKDLNLNLNERCRFEDTVTEDIADVMGLKLAYRGFRQMLEKNNGICQVLPGFEQFSCEKLFFIAFANNFCSALTAGDKEVVLSNDTHNLPEIRVNGAVANMKQFSLAFNCKPKAALNLKDTCDLWE